MAGMLWIQIPYSLAGALQHFAAGVLLSTVGTELLPFLLQASGVYENVGLTIGFFGGMGLLVVLGMALPDIKDVSFDDDASNTDKRAEGVLAHSLRRKSSSMRNACFSLQKRYWEDVLREEELSAGQLQNDDERTPWEDQALLTAHNTRASRANHRQSSSLSELLSINNSHTPFPTAFLAAVVVDSFLDGLLVGIASTVQGTAGPMMALSLSVEMSFIGLTLATALQGRHGIKCLLSAFAGPVILVGGALVGGLLSSTLQQHHPAFFVGSMAFGASALLFMVAEELLLEAHEQGDHVWWVDVQLYTGFYVR
jgi:zinc transporter ZupT